MSDSPRPHPDRRAPPPRRPQRSDTARVGAVARTSFEPGPQALRPAWEATQKLPDDDDDEPTEPEPGPPRLSDDQPTDPRTVALDYEPTPPPVPFDDEPTVPRPGPLCDEPTDLRPRPLADEPTVPRPRPQVEQPRPQVEQPRLPPPVATMTEPEAFTRPDTPEPPPTVTPPLAPTSDESWSYSSVPDPIAPVPVAPAAPEPAARRPLRVRFLAGGLIGSATVLALFWTAAWMSRDAAPPVGIEPSAKAGLPIRISAGADGVPITIDGDEVGSAPTVVTLSPGLHEVVVGTDAAATVFQLEAGPEADAWCFGQRQGRFQQVACSR